MRSLYLNGNFIRQEDSNMPKRPMGIVLDFHEQSTVDPATRKHCTQILEDFFPNIL
jgi:hypothetical protein